MGGVVTYTKEMKIRALGVPAELIVRGTAVCADVAEAMARGACRLSGASLGVSITGVAGPKPDEDGNPVGLVYCSVPRADESTRNSPTRLLTTRVWKRSGSSARFAVPSLPPRRAG
jgi:PncC family amidohydrolase